MTTLVSIAQGGTGSNSAALARTALGVPPSAAYDQANTARDQANTARTQANSAYSDANTRLSASGGTLAGDLIITGNLTVSGNSTTLNAEILTIEDADVVLLSNVASTPALNAGIIVNRGTSTNTFLRWDEVTDKWGWSDDGSTTYKFTSALDAYAQANSAYGAANNRVLKAGDTMTGQLNISSGGLLVTGNVGIGTSSPATKLHVNGGSSGATANPTLAQVVVENNADAGIQILNPNGNIGRVYFGNPGDPDSALIRWEYTNNNFDFATDKSGAYIRFLTDLFQERMRITSSGNVGIGTTSPGKLLDVAGEIRLTTGLTITAVNSSLFNQDGTLSYYQNNNGVYLNGAGASGWLRLNGSGVENTRNCIDIYGSGGDRIEFRVANGEGMRLNSTGLGIGTTSPISKTTITRAVTNTVTLADSNNASHLTLAGSDALVRLQLGCGGSSLGFAGWIQASYDNTGGAFGVEPLLLNPSGGNVGIGTTSPAQKLHVVGAVQADDFRSAISSQVFFLTGDEFRFRTSGGTERMRIGSTGNFGIGTDSPSYKFHIAEGGITAAAISSGWPAYNAELAAQSKTVLYLDAGGNGAVSTGGTGASVVVLMGQYNDARGIITMAGAGGATPSDAGMGYGRDLMVKAGNSDNGNGLVGGRLFLAGGSGYSGGAFGSNYGAVVLQPQGGGVGIGTTNPGSSTKLYVNGQSTLKRLQKQVYNWYTTSGSSYVHFKTTLKLTGTGYHVGMWSWRFYGYSYGTARIIDSYFGMHSDGSGNIYSAAYQDQGEFAFCTNMYKSSDNFLVIVGLIDNTYFFCLDVDIQHVADYAYMELGISAVSQSANTSGVY